MPCGVCVLKQVPDMSLSAHGEGPGELSVLVDRLNVLRANAGKVLRGNDTVRVRSARAPEDVPREAGSVLHELPSAPVAGPYFGV